MYIGNTLYSIILPILRIITVKGNAVNLTDAIHGFPDHNVDPADMMHTMQIMMQILLNQTSETTDCKDGKSEQTVWKWPIHYTNVTEQGFLSGSWSKQTVQISLFPGIFHEIWVVWTI